MTEIRNISLLAIVMAAVLCDLQSQRIPNGVIFTGMTCGFCYQILQEGSIGFILFAGGCLMPILLFSVLYYFRMIGAGDIKLLCVLGAFLGPYECVVCMTAAVLVGGGISLVLICRRRLFMKRLSYLAEYISQYSNDKVWKPYLKEVGEEARFAFSVPVLVAVLCYIGGIF